MTNVTASGPIISMGNAALDNTSIGVGLGALAERPAPLPGFEGRPSPRRAASTIGRASGLAVGAGADGVTTGAGFAATGAGAAATGAGAGGAAATGAGAGVGFGGVGWLAAGAGAGAAGAPSAAKNRCQEASTD